MPTRFLLLTTLFACATGAGRPETQASATAEEREVLQVIQGTFDAMRARDTAALRAHFHPDARIVTTGMRAGQPVSRTVSIDQFVASVGGAREELNERFWSPEVRIDDNLATVWTSYDFHVGGRFSHCGVDAFQLVRTTAGWRIIHVTDTHRTERCAAPPGT